MEILRNRSLKQFNTFGLSVHSNYFTAFSSIRELIDTLASPVTQPLKKMVLGGGSNILFTADYPGLMLHNQIKGIGIVQEDASHVLVKSGGGEIWHELVLWAVNKGLGGIENLSLIPGLAGAAPIQNIGAYGVELKNTFRELEAVDLDDGSIRTFDFETCRFGYRDSIFKREAKNKYAIVSITLQLDKVPKLNTSYGAIEEELNKMKVSKPGVADVSRAVIRIRQSKLPDPAVIGNAGSFFKNPEVQEEFFEMLRAKFPDIPGYPASPGHVKLAAGWMIEACGWKGKRSGKVGMHEKQALVLVNYGDASGGELLTHARRVQSSVFEKFGVELEMEVNIL